MPMIWKNETAFDPSFPNKAVACCFFRWRSTLKCFPWCVFLMSSFGNPLWKPDANLSANSGGSFSYSAWRPIMFLSALEIISRIILESTLPSFLWRGECGLDFQIAWGATVSEYKRNLWKETGLHRRCKFQFSDTSVCFKCILRSEKLSPEWPW